MKKITIIFAALCIGTVSAFGQAKTPAKATPPPPKAAAPAPPPKDTVFFDKSFLEAGTPPTEKTEFHLVPKFYKAGVLTPEQPIALSRAKKEAMDMVREKPCPYRKDCLNLIYTVDPIYEDGVIAGSFKGTIVIKWDIKNKVWNFGYLKEHLTNIDQNAVVFMYEAMQ